MARKAEPPSTAIALGSIVGDPKRVRVAVRRLTAANEHLAFLRPGRHEYLHQEPDPPQLRALDGVPYDVRAVVTDCAQGRRKWPLVLVGPAGSGKSCLGLCIVDNYGGWYTGLAQFCETVNAADFGRLCWSNSYTLYLADLWRMWRHASVTVLDELALKKPTGRQYETLLEALNNRRGKPSVVISNLGLDDLATVYDDRVASRLRAGTVLRMTGDRRISETPKAELVV